MNVKEAAALLSAAPDYVRLAIETGMELPRSGKLERLKATKHRGEYEITDEHLDDFVSAFAREDPRRNPPVAVRRELRVEALHKCGICRQDLSPLYFHHIMPWRKLTHHDPRAMLAVCGACHGKIETGQIDRAEQLKYKMRLQDAHEAREHPSPILPTGAGTPVSWSDLEALIGLCHELIGDEPTSASQHDLSGLQLGEKNQLNALSSELYDVMREIDEPYFFRIQEFLENPRNHSTTVRYHEVVDELRRRVASATNRFAEFDDILHQLHVDLLETFGDRLDGKKRVLRTLMSFMYFNCDIGRTV